MPTTGQPYPPADEPPQAPPTKGFLGTTTARGLIVVLLAQLLGELLPRFGVAPSNMAEVAEWIVTGAGLAIAAYGRWTATHKVSGLVTPKS